MNHFVIKRKRRDAVHLAISKTKLLNQMIPESLGSLDGTVTQTDKAKYRKQKIRKGNWEGLKYMWETDLDFF